MSLRVIQPGTHTMVVGPARFDLRKFGVSVGGPADPHATALANAFAGNPSDAALLEIALAGPVLEALDSCCVALVGPRTEAWIDVRPVPSNACHSLRPGERFRIGRVQAGARVYLAVPGGFGTAQGSLKTGQGLDCEPSEGRRRELAAELVEAWADAPGTLRVMPGPQADWFIKGDWTKPAYRVTADSNRMGIRLQGTMLTRRPGELVSEAVAPGAVQVTNEGQMIILGVDGQTIGGYPKIAHVIAADMWKLGQLEPGREIRFERVDLPAAEAAWISQVAGWEKNLRRVRLARDA